MGYSFTREDIEEQKRAIKIERAKLEQSISLFNPDWSVVFPKNSLALICAGSGVGKTTFVRQCIKECIIDEYKCLLFSNEERKATTIRNLTDSLLLEYTDMDEDAVLEWILEFCYIVDLDDTEDLEFYDKVPDLIMAAIEDFTPDVVFFDQISYCNRSANNSKKEPYKYLAELVNKFRPFINSETLQPPIVLIQQGKSIPGTLAGEANKDSSNTVNPCTHVIQVFREEDDTFLEVQKWRNVPDDVSFKRYTRFDYDTKLDIFDLIEESNSYEKPYVKKREGAF